MAEEKAFNSSVMTNESGFFMVKMDSLTLLYNEVKSLREEINALKIAPQKQLYTNKEVMELLGVKDKLLKKYREKGWLSYRQVNDKYWYTQKDIDQFLNNHCCVATKTAW